MKVLSRLSLRAAVMVGILLAPLAARAAGPQGTEGVFIQSVGGPLLNDVCEETWNLRLPHIVNASNSDRLVRVVYYSSSPYFGSEAFTSELAIHARFVGFLADSGLAARPAGRGRQKGPAGRR